MRRNWAQIFGAVPDIQADVVHCAVDGTTLWTEWDMYGTLRDGSPFHNVMVTIAGIEHDQVVWMRLFMDEVRRDGDIDTAVRSSLGESAHAAGRANPGGNVPAR
jgi:hypothetical protein